MFAFFSSRKTASSFLAALLALFAVTVSSCGAPHLDCHTQEGKAAILDAVQNALTSQNCTAAIDLIEPAYQDKDCTNDEVRMARASAYACAANINFFKLIGDIATVNLTGNALWPALTKLFPSVPTDSRVAAGELSLDALMALKAVGSIATPAQLVNATTPNPGYLLAHDRTVDSNIYAIFVSMSLIGAFQNRYGNPNLTTFAKGRNMGAPVGSTTGTGGPAGWADITNMTPDACSYATSILTLVDSINEVSQQVSGKVGTTLSQVGSTFSSLLDQACSAGCSGNILLFTFTPIPTRCSISCSGCPIGLRNRASCSTSVTDPVSCAAAGIAAFVNSGGGGLGWQ